MAKQITFEQWKKQNPERLNDWRKCTNCYGSGDDELTCRACEYCNGEGSINKAREYYVADLMFDSMRLKAWSAPNNRVHADAGDSAVSKSSLQASADTTSQTVTKRTQRG